MEENKKKDCEYREVGWFLLYAFAIPFACLCIMRIIEAYDKTGVITLMLYAIEGASPALAAILVTLQKHGISGLKEFLENKYKDAFSIRLCIIGLCTPVFVLTIGKVLTYLTPYHNQFITGINSKKLIIIMWALIAEELAWRGFLQDKIEAYVGGALTPFIVGIIWTVWHFHFFISGSMEVSLFVFTYGCIAESYGYFVLMKMAKGNIVPASLWHFSGNLFTNLYRIDPKWNDGRMEPYMIVNAIYFVYVIAFVAWYMRHKQKKP